MAREYSVRSAAAHKCLRYVYEALVLMPVIVIVFAFALTWLGRIGKEICQISQTLTAQLLALFQNRIWE